MGVQILPGRFQDGSAAIPAKTYILNPTLGAYRIGSNNEGFSAGATLRWDYDTTRLKLSASYQLQAGSNVLIGSVADKLNAAHLAIASQAIGDLLYADAATTFARLADVATGSVLVSGGIGAAPAWSASPTLTSVTLSGSGNVLTLPNAAYIYSKNTTGVAHQVFGVTGANLLSIDVDGFGAVFGGALTASGLIRGNAGVRADAGQPLGVVSRGYFNATGDGLYQLLNEAGALTSTFSVGTALVVGTTPSTTGAVRLANAAGINWRNAANTGDIQVLALDSGNRSALGDVTNTESIVLYGQRVMFGGITASFPALKRSSAGLQARLADDSGYTYFQASYLYGLSGIIGPGTPATAGDIALQSGFTIKARNAANSADGTILSTNSFDSTGLAANTVTVANNASVGISAGVTAFVVITDRSTGIAATFQFDGGATVAIISDTGGGFSITAGTVNKRNVYWSAGNNRYEIENKAGASRGFQVMIFGN